MIYTKTKLPDLNTPEGNLLWRRMRQSGIGGSDAGVIMECNEYKTKRMLFMDKTETIDDLHPEQSEACWIGHEMEDIVARRFEQETGKSVQRSSFQYRSKAYPFMLADIDRKVVGENAGLECKTAGFMRKENIESGRIPKAYYWQCQHYMAVMGFDRMYIALMVYQKNFNWYIIERNEEDIAKLIEKEQLFWSDVESLQLPEPTGIDLKPAVVDAKFKKPFVVVDVSHPDYAYVKRLSLIYDQASAAEKANKTLKEDAKAKLLNILCDPVHIDPAKKYVIDNQIVSIGSHTSSIIDVKRMEQDGVLENFKSLKSAYSVSKKTPTISIKSQKVKNGSVIYGANPFQRQLTEPVE